MQTTKTKLRLLPGRGLTGRDIKARLRNRTLEGEVFGDESYTLNEDMNDFMKASRPEQIRLMKENDKRMKEVQKGLDTFTNAKAKKLEEQRIEMEIQKRMNEQGRQNANATSGDKKD